MALFCFLLALGTARAGDAGVRITTTVRADARTGKLVRKTLIAPVTVPSAPVAPKQIVAKPIDPPVRSSDPAIPARLHNLDVHRVVEETARTHEVDPLLVHSVIKAESNYNPAAVSPKGAMGLMQLMPATARRFGATNTFDIRQNIEAGVKYLRYLQDLFGPNQLALAAYNAGEGAVLKYGNVPPYRETENYVYRVGKFYGEALRSRRPQPPAAPAASELPPDGEPLRQLEIARDSEGRIVLRTR